MSSGALRRVSMQYVEVVNNKITLRKDMGSYCFLISDDMQTVGDM